MKPVKPNLGQNEAALTNGIIVAAYRDSEVANVSYVVTRWELTYEERQAISHGEDVFLIQSTPDDTICPSILLVGEQAFHEALTDSSSNTVPTDSEGEEDPSRFEPRKTEML